MSPVEIEEAVEALVELPFDPDEFPFQFLQAFDTTETAIKRLRKGNTNQSDIGGVLQRNNIHIATCAPGEVDAKFAELQASPKTSSAKAKFIVATDGETIQAEDLNSGATLAQPYADLPDHFGFFLPLAGITTVKEIRESSFDIKATGRLNRLYVELLKDNADWATDERRPDMNHFMARLIFCFFAEDTDIFVGEGLFTSTVQQMSQSDSSDTHTIISELFRAMDCKIAEREAEGIPRYANQFPYVNGELFSGSVDVPVFSRMARSYLIHIGNLDWKKINPDIFGSMIQAVADDDERGSLGMHYTSVPNILKVLNPLFLDDLREQLEAAGDNDRKLLNLRKRMAKIRVFDPACGSGNFLVIAYKAMREIEAEINQRRGEPERRSDIPLTNFRGIELRDFPAEIARLALIIAEYQCDISHRGQKEALDEFLPLDSKNWITCGNALRLDWLNICPPTGAGVQVTGDDLFETPLDQSEIDFENEGGETYICGNPPYKGNADQTKLQKSDISNLMSSSFPKWKSLDYICGWFFKSYQMSKSVNIKAALVSTNSISQGQSIPYFWKQLFEDGCEINFAITSFKWQNLASHNAGVTVVVIGFSQSAIQPRKIYEDEIVREVEHINPYLLSGPNAWIESRSRAISQIAEMVKGNYYGLSNGLLLDRKEAQFHRSNGTSDDHIRRFKGSSEIIGGSSRYCLWLIADDDIDNYSQTSLVARAIESVREQRQASRDPMARKMAETPHQFREMRYPQIHTIVMPVISSEKRSFLTPDLQDAQSVFSNAVFALYDADHYNFSILSSKVHQVWVATVCGKLETRLRYSNVLGWNTFPLPKLTEQNKADLTRCAENILLAREAHFPATIADLYDPEKMPEDLRHAHEANDETLERIYIGRRFRNDTERLEKLFELYTKMTAKGKAA